MLWLKLAARSAVRHRRRSLLAGGGMAVGLAALLLAWSMFDGLNAQLIRNMTATHSGHLQIQHQHQLDAPRLEHAFDPQALQPALAHPAIQASAPRLSATALLASERHARGVLVIGVDPRREPAVTDLSRHITHGRYLDPIQVDGLVLGEPLARALAVAPGDEVALVTEGLYGAIGAQRYRVAGIYSTGNDTTDAAQVFITLAAAQDLLSAPGRVSAIALRLSDIDHAATVAQALAPAVPATHRVRGWRELLPAVAQSVDFHEAVVRVIMWVLFGVVALGVTSTLQMSVAQRIREFGTLRAIGTRPAPLVRTIVYEASWIAAGALLLACALTVPLVAALARHGVDFSSHGQALQTMGGGATLITPQLRAERLLETAAGLLLVTVLAAAVPALKVARLSPVQALRGAWRTPRARPTRHPDTSRWPTALKLAARNLRRAPWRTGLSLAALSFGLAAFIFAAAFAEGFLAQMTQNATGLLSGDLQIQHRDYRTEARPEHAFAADPAWLERLRRLPGIAQASARVQVPATLGSARKAEPITLVGLDPTHDHAAPRLQRALSAGQPLRDERDVLIGRKLAERLDVRVGEKLVVTLQDADGQLTFDALRVAGLFDTGAHGPDAAMAFVPLARAQRLLALGPERITQVLLHLQPQADAAAAQQAVAGALPAGAGLQALAWQQLMPDIAQFASLVRHGLFIVLGIVFTMVAVIVANALLMSVLERSREFGTLLAIGARGASVVRLVLTESALIGALGVLIGTALGAGAAWVASITGVELAVGGVTATPGASTIVHPIVSLPLLAAPALLLFMLVLAAAVYPARRTVRLDPLQALSAT